MNWLRSTVEAVCYLTAPNSTTAAGMMIAWDDLVQRAARHCRWWRRRLPIDRAAV